MSYIDPLGAAETPADPLRLTDPDPLSALAVEPDRMIDPLPVTGAESAAEPVRIAEPVGMADRSAADLESKMDPASVVLAIAAHEPLKLIEPAVVVTSLPGAPPWICWPWTPLRPDIAQGSEHVVDPSGRVNG
jgi:hypothetical protein